MSRSFAALTAISPSPSEAVALSATMNFASGYFSFKALLAATACA